MRTRSPVRLKQACGILPGRGRSTHDHDPDGEGVEGAVGIGVTTGQGNVAAETFLLSGTCALDGLKRPIRPACGSTSVIQRAPSGPATILPGPPVYLGENRVV